MEYGTQYTMQEHRFRFAGWCAATAASSSPCCRFTVRTGLKILQLSGVSNKFVDWASIPSTSTQFDILHDTTCKKIIETAHLKEIEFSGRNPNFTYGVAAKLLNCYLKPIYLIHEPPLQHRAEIAAKQAFIHPPIDRVLLQNLQNNKIHSFKNIKSISWSKFDREQYLIIIRKIREFVDTEPLWKIEKWWNGHQ